MASFAVISIKIEFLKLRFLVASKNAIGSVGCPFFNTDSQSSKSNPLNFPPVNLGDCSLLLMKHAGPDVVK